MRFALLLLAVLATGWSELMHRPAQQIPATITEALTVSKGTYSAHFRKQSGKNVYELRVASLVVAQNFKNLSFLQVVPMNYMDMFISMSRWSLWSMYAE